MPYNLDKFFTFIFFLSILLILPAETLAFSGSGGGTTGNPYSITTCEQLQEINDELTAHYVLSNDIDCSDTSTWNAGAGFLPISNFEGSFNGQGNEISNLAINRPGTNNVGLFGLINGFGNNLSITNVTLVDVDITGNDYVGGLVGRGTTFPLTKISVSGQVHGTRYVGGIAGGLFNVIPQETRASVDVTASGRIAGGLIGIADSDAGAKNSYAKGAVVTGSDSGGGLIGAMTTGGIENSYATGSVTAVNAAGGLVGTMGTGDTVNSFATGLVTVTNPANPSGGLVGNLYDSGDIINGFYDQTGTGQEDCEGTGADTCTGIDTSENPDYFKANNSNPPLNQWNFNTIWGIGDNYPLLRSVDDIPVDEDENNDTDGNEISSPINSSDSGGNSPAPECSDTEPEGMPDLFRIDAGGTYVNLYFSTVKGTTGYNINYGLTDLANQYGDMFKYSGPAWIYGRTIYGLAPNTTYYFKVQGTNGCNAGGWSKVVEVKTKNKSFNLTNWFANLAK